MKMNNNKIILATIWVIILFITSCERLETVESPIFDITVEKSTFLVGEPVDFIFTGNADIITIYTGEAGNDYNRVDAIESLEPSYTMNFETQCIDGTQPDQMSILFSTNFSGIYSLDEIHKADWIDIADRFNMPAPQETREFVLSGVGDFTDLLNKEEYATKMYMAVRQIVKNQIVNGNGNLNRVRRISIDMQGGLADGQLYNHNALGWTMVSSENKEENRTKVVSNSLEFRANLIDKEAETEDWAVSKQLEFTSQIDLPSDWGVCIKGINDEAMSSYSHSFSEPGNYTVVFVAINANAIDSKEVVRKIELSIEANE